ncbi:MAG: tetratricopeptide repeat protein [bacterium]
MKEFKERTKTTFNPAKILAVSAVVALALYFAGCSDKNDSKLYQAGKELQEANQYDLAIEKYENLIKGYPESMWKDAASTQIGECKKAKEFDKKFEEKVKLKNEFDEMVKLKDRGMYLASREMLLKFAKEHSGTGFDQEAFYQIGLCYEAEEDLDKAIEYLKKAGKNHQPAQAEIKQVEAKKLYLEEAKKLSQIVQTEKVVRQARQENVRKLKEGLEREFEEEERKRELKQRYEERLERESQKKEEWMQEQKEQMNAWKRESEYEERKEKERKEKENLEWSRRVERERKETLRNLNR